MQWNMRQRLEELAEPKFQAFSATLLPGTGNILGVRLPTLRQMAKEICHGDWRDYLNHATEDTFEETMLQGLVIGFAPCSLDETLALAQAFVPKITNWSLCDAFCAGLKKKVRQNPQAFWVFLQPYLVAREEYALRFGVVMLLDHFVTAEYIQQVLHILEETRHPAYYVRMAVAWAISICFVHFPQETMAMLQTSQQDTFTYNKALQKITESLRVDPQTKDIIRKMKRKEEHRPL